jgi:hypothetical protein
MDDKVRSLHGHNRHPADELADIRAQIKELEARQQVLREWLIAHPHDLRGASVRAAIHEWEKRRVLDQRASKAFFGMERLQAFYKPAPLTVVNLYSIKQESNQQ